MKIRFYLALAAAALVMTNCSQEEALVQVNQPSKGFTATIEGASRSNATEAGVFSWTVGDEISVHIGNNNFDVYKNSEADVNTFTFALQGEESAGTPAGYAIYPAGEHSISDQDVTINLPATYAYGSTNAPMLATIEEGSSNLAFKHLAGMMRFVVNNVPAGASSFVFTTENNILTGTYSVMGDNTIKQNGTQAVTASNNSVTITFEESDIQEKMVFFVPLPVGTYGNYTVAIKGTNVDLSCDSEGVSNTIGRCTMLLMPEFTVEGDKLNKGAGSTIAIDAEEANLSGNQSVTIDASGVQDASATLVLNYTPQEGNATLNITDGSGEEESQNSKAKIEIQPEGAVESLNLNTPTLTVELGEGSYGTVEALTANQTLIIGEGVTIGTLILNGGALQVAEDATIDEIIVKDELGLRSAVSAGGKVTLQKNIELTGYDQCLWIKKDCEIDLCEYDIKHSESTVIKIAAGGILTIGGNGAVETTDAECGAIANYGGTLIINGGTYKSIGAGAIYCDRGEGDTWNLIIEDGTFIATNSTAVSLQNNNGDTDAKQGLADIKGGTFIGVENVAARYDLYLANVIANIDAANCTFSQGKGVWLQTSGQYSSVINGNEVSETIRNGMYLVSTEEELRTAISVGGKISLLNSIELTGYDECLWIENDCEIDLCEYDIKHSESTVIKIAAGGKLTIGGNGTVETTDAECGAIANYGGTLIINGGIYKSIGAGAIYCDRGEGETWNLTIEDGTFIASNSTAVSLQNNNGDTAAKQGLADIKGGTFTGVENVAARYDLYLANVIANIDAANCTFSQGKGVWLQTSGQYNSVINGTTYTEVSEGVANGYILNN